MATPGYTPQFAANRYMVSRELARGGMGAILEANDVSLDREVAMKVMLEAGEQDPVARQRFQREALVLARLSHPNIVPIHEMGRDEQGRRFYTMKLVKGRTLQAILKAIRSGDPETLQHYTLDRLLTIYRKVCDAVAFAHHQRIIHRDLKPDNVMVGEFGEVLVMDWGLAKHLDDEQHAQAEAERAQTIEGFNELSDAELAAGAGNLTMEGAVMGSPQYMPPEQAEGRLAEIGTHSDIYSLGAVLYAILTLRHPVEGKNVSDVLAKVRSGVITPPTTYNTIAGSVAKSAEGVEDTRKFSGLAHCPGGKVPASLSAVTMRAMALQPGDRYADVAALVADIEAYQGGFATSAEQVSTFGQIVLLVKRNQGAAIAAAAGLAVVVVLTAVFVRGLRAKEREALRAADLAITEKEKALKAEREARGASALAQIALAEAAFRVGDIPAMVQALEACPPDKRDQSWRYLSAKRDASLGPLRVAGFESPTVVAALPGAPGQFALVNGQGRIGFVDAGSGKLLRAVQTGRRNIRNLVFAGDGRTFALYAGGQAVDVHDSESGERRNTLNLPVAAVTEFALSHDGAWFTATSTVTNFQNSLFQLSTGTGVVRWQRQGRYLGSLLMHSAVDRLMLASGGASRNFWLLRASDGTELATFPVYALCQALHPDGKVVAIGTQQGEVLLVNTTSGAIIQQGKLHSGRIAGMAWTADGHLITQGGEGKIEDSRWLFRLWDPMFLAPRGAFAGLKSAPAATRWAFNPNSGHVLTHESPPRLWSIPAGREAVRLQHRSEQAWGGAFVADTLLVARKGFFLGCYDMSKPGQMIEMAGTPQLAATICTAHPATGLFAIGQKVGQVPTTLKLFATAGGAVTEKFSLSMPARTLDFGFDLAGERIAVASDDGALTIISAKNGAALLKARGDCRYLAFAGKSGQLVGVVPHTVKSDAVEFHLRQLDSTTGKPLVTATNRFHVQALAVSPDRRLVALGGSDRAVHLFEADTLREQPGFRAHDGDVGALTFHPAQPIIATASADGSVKLWDHRNGQLLADYLGLAGNPVVLSFSPNGKLLMVDGQEQTTRVYDVSEVKASP